MKVTMNLESMDFKLNALEVEYKNISLIAGMNNTGKSFVSKVVWFTQHVFGVYHIFASMDILNKDQEIESYINQTFGWTFIESDQISGDISIDTDTTSLKLTFEYGKLSDFDLNILDDVKFKKQGITQVLYNTQNARLFTQYEQYQKIKEAMGLQTVNYLDDMQKICSIYRLYDVMWFEYMSAALKDLEENGLQKVEPALENICSTFNKGDEITGLKSNDFLVKDGGIYIHSNTTDKVKSILQFSDGFQAYCLLTIFNFYQTI